ncbi:ChaN family lipoprotein [Rhodobacteraceae bacterium F11138]|nr:ChaN family lipoprotein [Rhodobacteraceae bacterium F11138]
MRIAKILMAAIWAMSGTSVPADPVSPKLMSEIATARVVILGETHDNGHHHALQARIVAQMAPKAVVWEMLTSEDAGRVNAALIRDPEELARVLQWAESHWPDFSMYLPIFQAAPEARLYGGEVPRAAARNAMRVGPAVAFGADAARYGLTIALPPEEQAARELMQMQAHCGAIPQDMLAGMVGIQRLRDAVLTREVLRALEETGGPVAVITGNGHARRDWGIPVYLDRVQPGLPVLVIGQSEQGEVQGQYDVILDSPAVDRQDPCDAFSTSDQ